MTPKIDTILFATDLSDTSRHAFGYAVDLAEKYEAKINIVHVMENLNHSMEIQISEMVGVDRWNRMKADTTAELKKKIRERVHSFCASATPDEASCELLVTDVHIKKGLAWEEILETADTLGADMIVMGTNGYSPIKDVLMGGTARKVVKRSRVPALTVRLPGD
ncbi:MAG: universal stress protein [Desulfobacterales bacterium]|nr:universal stress protein [Desulfobacterales bacterium]